MPPNSSVLTGHHTEVVSVAFSVDATHPACASGDGPLRLFYLDVGPVPLRAQIAPYRDVVAGFSANSFLYEGAHKRPSVSPNNSGRGGATQG